MTDQTKDNLVPDKSGWFGNVHVYRPGYKRKAGPLCKLWPEMRGQTIKTDCCRQMTLARECNIEIRDYEWFGPDFIVTCKPRQGHCGGTKAYG